MAKEVKITILYKIFYAGVSSNVYNGTTMESEMDILVRARFSTPTRGPDIETLIPTSTLLHLLQTWGGSREELAYCGFICYYRW